MDRKWTKNGQNMSRFWAKLNRKWTEKRQKMDRKWTKNGPFCRFFLGLTKPNAGGVLVLVRI